MYATIQDSPLNHLHHRIQLLNTTHTPDEWGGWSPTLEVISEVWAAVRPLKQRGKNITWHRMQAFSAHLHTDPLTFEVIFRIPKKVLKYTHIVWSQHTMVITKGPGPWDIHPLYWVCEATWTPEKAGEPNNAHS